MAFGGGSNFSEIEMVVPFKKGRGGDTGLGGGTTAM